MIGNKKNAAFLINLCKLFIVVIALYSQSEITLAQVNRSANPLAGGNYDDLITIKKNSSYEINIEVSKETLVYIALFDETDKLTSILFYEYVKPGILEYDLARNLPKGDFTCKIIIGEDTEVLRLIVI